MINKNVMMTTYQFLKIYYNVIKYCNRGEKYSSLYLHTTLFGKFLYRRL